MTTLSLYRQAMGPAFEGLPPALRAFHSLQGRHVLHGQVRVHAPASRLATCLAWCLGAPLRAQDGPIRFELEASPALEVWTRHFPTRTMRSTLRLHDGHVVEQLGPARLSFKLSGTHQHLAMRHAGLHVLGVPCPSWLMPRIVAEEMATDGRLHFRVEARLPVIGLVARYEGHLDVAEGGLA